MLFPRCSYTISRCYFEDVATKSRIHELKSMIQVHRNERMISLEWRVHVVWSMLRVCYVSRVFEMTGVVLRVVACFVRICKPMLCHHAQFPWSMPGTRV